MAIESSFIPFPSEVIVPPAAWLAAQGELNVVLVVLAATLGADVGALVNYALALWLGRPLVYKLAGSRWGRFLLLDEQKVAYAEAYFQRHGVLSTLVGRLIPAVRQLISIPAGLARMPLPQFLLYTTLGAGAWNVVLAAIGYALIWVPGLGSKEEVVAKASQYSHYIGYGLMAAVLCALLFALWRQRKPRQQ